jgi:guanylate kinase
MSRKIIVFTAPSGSGKTTIARRVMESLPGVRFSVSATTRPPRDGEKEGVDYYFVSADRFRQLISDNAFLEFEEVYPDRFYGTLESEVSRRAEDGPLLLDVDVKGAVNVKARYGDEALTLFIRPPSIDVLEERLRARGTETDASLRTRLQRAREELTYEPHFDTVIVNDDLEMAISETFAAIERFLAV